jgi:catechol 2,3-dioxygenase
MGTRTQDIFGDPSSAEPATPGSYGQAPRGCRLPVATHLGMVVLQVSRLDTSLACYQEVLGFRVLARDGARATLAAHGDDRPLIELRERPGARPVPPRGCYGLYHFAILLPDRASLGRFVRHLADIGIRAGAGDHLVSEAFYLHDPDNLGIEVYADRPRSTWRRIGRELMMATDPVDVASLLKAAGENRWSGMPAGTTLGHVHLHVGDLVQAGAFYGDGLGFDRMAWHYPGALFFGAGGYHHHLGTNTWAGETRPAAEDEARLLEWEVLVPSQGDVEAALESLAAAGAAVERRPDGGAARDPWGTVLRLRGSNPS